MLALSSLLHYDEFAPAIGIPEKECSQVLQATAVGKYSSRTILVTACVVLFSAALAAQPSGMADAPSPDLASLPRLSLEPGLPASTENDVSDESTSIGSAPNKSGADAEESPSRQNLVPSNSTLLAQPPSNKIQWKPAIVQSLELQVFQHAFRAAFDPSMRYLIAHKPFWHDYGVSLTDYHMDHWSDGDSFVVNDVGHPLNGAVYGRVLLQNNPKSFVEIGRHNGYWTTRLQSLAWMALWSTLFEVGPLSETSLGSQGGFYYSNGCGTSKACLTTPPYSAGANKHTGVGGVTNNTGWTDFIMTPLVGLGWEIGEDAIDRYLVTPIAREHRILGGRVLRTALEPSRSFAALFAGKFPWMLPAPENHFVVNARPKPLKAKDPNQAQLQHYALGAAYTNISLPVLTTNCLTACRQSFSAMGTTFTYKFTRGFGFDSSYNFIPAQQGSKAMMQGLFEVRLGQSFQHVGVFGKVRPGFVYYQKALPGGGDPNPTSLTRFAWDVGGIVEVYPQRESRSAIRFDIGTTLVRYLTDRVDTRYTEIGGVISNQYYTTQGNFQFSTGYVYRF